MFEIENHDDFVSIVPPRSLKQGRWSYMHAKQKEENWIGIVYKVGSLANFSIGYGENYTELEDLIDEFKRICYPDKN